MCVIDFSSNQTQPFANNVLNSKTNLNIYFHYLEAVNVV